MDVGVVIIVVVAIVGGVAYDIVKQHYKHQKQQPEVNSVKYDSEIQALKDRIAALETIVTDKSYQLKNEINQLK